MLRIYKASAGSGKTFTLAKEYIRLLLGMQAEDGTLRLNPNPLNSHRAILAITFTNKATEEMKRRIVHELAVLAEAEPGWAKPSDYITYLTEELHCNREQLKKSALLALNRLLFDFNFFQVSTIDSFFQSILRAFTREAELTGNYELELDGNEMVREGMNRLIESLSTNHDSTASRELSESIIKFMVEKLENSSSSNLLDKSGTLYSTLLSSLAFLNDEELAKNPDVIQKYMADPSLLEKFKTTLQRNIATTKVAAVEACKKALTMIDSDKIDGRFVSGLTNFIDGKESVSTYFAKIARAENGAMVVVKKNKVVDSATLTAIEEAADAVMAYLSVAELYNAVEKNLFPMSLMKSVAEKMEEYRAENHSVLISDTSSLLRMIIGDDDAPFVFERMGVWLNHFLIDEFQDTSEMQWENLRSLVTQGLSENYDSLIIGDEKQCIYRFRNSKPELLGSRVADELSDYIDDSDDSPNSNWRSSRDVVEFNNSLFEAMAANNSMAGVYENVKQNVQLVNRKGYVKVSRIDQNDFTDKSLSMLADDIRRQIASGYLPSEIAILTRTNGEGKDIIEYLLRLQLSDSTFPKFGIISDDAMALSISPAVKIIVSALRAYTNHDSLSSDSRRSRLNLDRMISGYESGIGHGLTPDEALSRAISQNSADVEPITSHRSWSLVSLVEGIISTELPEFMYSTQNGFISAFMDVVHDFCSRRQAADLQSFLKWWDEKGDKCMVSAPADTDAIRVMTIHKSKGLEFPCVHLPFLVNNIFKKSITEWVDTTPLTLPGAEPESIPKMLLLTLNAGLDYTCFAKHRQTRVNEQLLDEINALYVGFTRAIDELCVHYDYPVTKGGKTTLKSQGTLLHNALISAFGVTLSPDTEYVVGSPTTPQRSTRRLTALDPKETLLMPPFASIDREDIWQGIEVDENDD